MGARIESVSARRARRGPLAPGALGLSDATAKECLERASRDASELDLLVNAGLYKDHHMAEPALAAIIQEDIGANPGHPVRAGHHGTFSFDVMNGGCGVLSALFLLDSFVAPGTAQLGMVVAADADPDPRHSRGYRFPPVGGAVLLGHTPGPEGFVRFEFRTFPEEAGMFESRIGFDPHAGPDLLLRRGASILEVREDSRFAAACLARGTGVAGAFLDHCMLRVEAVDLLIASPYPRGFASDVAAALRIPASRLPELPAEHAGAHTAGPIAALAAAMDGGRFERAHNVLFVAVGAGLTVATALYRRGSP